MLARRDPCIVEIPQLGALIPWIPLTELITKRKDSFLSACLFLVAPCPTKGGVEFELFNCAEQSWNLQPVAASIRAARLCRNTSFNCILHSSDDKSFPKLGRPTITKFNHLREIVPSVYVKQRERKARWTKSRSEEHTSE